VIYAHQLQVAIGICIQDLEIIAAAGEADDLNNAVLFLPLEANCLYTVSQHRTENPTSSNEKACKQVSDVSEATYFF
jgi:hypothetical protein